MAVHFKFRSAVDYDSIPIDGQFITVGNLKERIIEHKNLGKSINFDLVIADAQTGEEYEDETHLLPRNTSVIIKRVPAVRGKSTLQVYEQSRIGDEPPANENDASSLPHSFSVAKAEVENMDDFGVDLYTLPKEQLPTTLDADEGARIATMVEDTATEWHRQTLEGTTVSYTVGRGTGGRGIGRGRGCGRIAPPCGYVCHRCGQPGHYIQHCPTNGDPAYDMKKMKMPIGIPKTRLRADYEGSYMLPDGSIGAMQPDEVVFAKEAGALPSGKATCVDIPSEFKCFLCQGIFKDAVMIPCCHYSFCDKCIRQELISNGNCPQCGSSKSRNDDLLPNIALRQAIDHFLEAQLANGVDQVTDGGVSQHSKNRLQLESKKPVVTGTTAPVVFANSIKEKQGSLLAESVCDSTVGDRQNGDGVNLISPAVNMDRPECSAAIDGQIRRREVLNRHDPGVKDMLSTIGGEIQHTAANESGVLLCQGSGPVHMGAAGDFILGADINKGKKKKKRSRPLNADGAGLDFGKFRKGDRFCYVCGSPDHLARDCSAVYSQQSGMFPAGVPMNPMPAYAPDMFWQGPSMAQQMTPYPLGYGDGMYGRYDTPVPYGISPFMPPFFVGASMHSGLMPASRPAMIGSTERPLSREEFLELQERERLRRLMPEQEERSELSQGRLHPKEMKRVLRQMPHMEHSEADHVDWTNASRQRHELDRDSVRNYSDDAEHHKSKMHKSDKKKKCKSLDLNTSCRKHHSFSGSDDPSCTLRSRKSKRSVLDRENMEHEHDHGDSSIRISMKKSRRKKHAHTRHSLDEGSEGYSSRHRSQKQSSEDVDYEVHSEGRATASHGKHAQSSTKEKGKKPRESSGCSLGDWEEVSWKKQHHAGVSRRDQSHSDIEYESDGVCKKKKKHRRQDEIQEKKVHLKHGDEAERHQRHSHRRHHRHKSSHVNENESLEDSRWQLDSGRENLKSLHETHHSKHKHRHSHKRDE